MNSNVIRGFEKTYKNNEQPDLLEVIKNGVLIYAHCSIKLGIKMKI